MKSDQREQLLATIESWRRFETIDDVPDSSLNDWCDLCWELCSVDAQMLPQDEIVAIAEAANGAANNEHHRNAIFSVAVLALTRPGPLIQGDRGTIYAAARLIYDTASAERTRRRNARRG